MGNKKIVRNFWSFIFTFCMIFMAIGGYFNPKVNATESKCKLYIGDQLCIDTTCETPITTFDNSDFSIYKSSYDDSYNLEIKTSNNIGNIQAQGNIDLVIHLNKAATVSAIENVRNLAVLGENSQDVLNVVGNIKLSGSLVVNGNTKAGKIENAKQVVINNSSLDVNSDNNAFENIGGGILVCGKSKLDISSANNNLNTKVYSVYAIPEENTILNAGSLSKKEVIWNSNIENYQSSYLHDGEKYTWSLNCEGPKLRKFVYGKNIFSENLNSNDNIQVLKATGIKLDDNTYELSPGSIVRIKVDSANEKSLNENFVNSLSLKNTDISDEFEFTMPDRDLYLKDIFTENSIKSGVLQNALMIDEIDDEVDNQYLGANSELTTTVNYNGEDLNVILRDPNNAIEAGAVLDVQLVKYGDPDYDGYYQKLDDKYKKDSINHRVFFEIKVYKDENKNEDEKYTDLGGKKVQILFQIPNGWDKDAIQAVLILDNEDDGFDEETVTIDNKNYVSFFTDHFSPYSFLYDDDYQTIAPSYDDEEKPDSTVTASVADDDKDDSDNVSSVSTYKTGDWTSKMLIYVATGLIISGFGILVVKNKRRKNV